MSQISDVQLKQEIERRLCRSREADKNLIKSVRKLTGFDDALNRNKLFHYREKGLPRVFLEGAAVGFLIQNEHVEAEGISHFDNDKYNNFFGVTFEEISYSCDLKIGKDFPNFFDAEVTVRYINPTVSQKLGESVIKLQSTSDARSGSKNNFMSDFDIFGKGIDLIGGKPKITNVISTKNEKTLASKVQVVHLFKINSKYNGQKRGIKVKKKAKNMFFAKESGPIQVAGLKIIRPTKSLKIQLNFPKDIFKPGKFPVVKIIACEEDTHNLEHIDYDRTTTMLIENTSCQSIAPGCYEWVSRKPPITSIHYTLSYTTEDIRRCL